VATSMVRVLAVDDFESFRRFAASQLGKRPELQIIGEASDGSEAVQKAEALQPDLILLDIGLPKLNGIEAARRIRKHSPDCKILFISQDSSVDTVHTALETGASGYIVKSDAGRELLPAVEAILRGEQFIGSRFAGHDFSHNGYQNGAFSGDSLLASGNSQTLKNFHSSGEFSPSTPQRAEGVCCHEVHFYSKEESLHNRVADYIGRALRAGDAAVVVATEPHRNGIELKLQALGLDVRDAPKQGRYTSVDTGDAISSFTVNGELDSVRFQKLFADLIAKVAESVSKDARVAVFGECVQVMWARGNAEAAIQMEKLTNDFMQRCDVHMLCAYPLAHFHGPQDAERFQRICSEHSAVYRE